MFRAQLGEEVEVDSRVAEASNAAAQLRDKMFDQNQGTAVKAVIGTVIGMYLIWRFLLNRY